MKTFKVKFEWLMSSTLSIQAETEEESLEKARSLTKEQVIEIINKGEFEKGSLEAIEAYEKEPENSSNLNQNLKEEKMIDLTSKEVWSAKLTWEEVIEMLDEEHRIAFNNLMDDQKIEIINEYNFLLASKLDDELMNNWNKAMESAISCTLLQVAITNSSTRK